jgi:hypothetical protein
LTAQTYSQINYEKVTSKAFKRYQDLFAEKDTENFEAYIEKVAQGKSKISGAVLLPSTLVHEAGTMSNGRKSKSLNASLQSKIIDGQWKTLVERVQRSGKLESSIAVCDVSGSMGFPVRSDKTTPMDSSIGLSLLLAEICDPPFGGHMITFSANPSFIKVGGKDDKRSFPQKLRHIYAAEAGYDTNFVAVFERLILPMAKEHNLKQEDMVKQVFVFSDMQFNQAESRGERWTSSYERIRKRYSEAGYEMPTLIFWNLAGQTTGVPVDAQEPGTVLVSGYSQGQMKMFLDGEGFEETEDEKISTKDMGEEGEKDFVEVTREEKQIDSIKAVEKAISHPAYSMIKVLD